jgi:hypothetical protein
MADPTAIQLAEELEQQHRVFFRNTGLLMAGGGVLALVIGLQFIAASTRPTHRSKEAYFLRGGR